jgi:hypothetical protein
LRGEGLQEKQPAVQKASSSFDSGQDTTEYVLIIILFVLAFTTGLLVWTRSVEGSYGESADCISSSVGPETGSSGTPLARRGDQYEIEGAGRDRPGRECPPDR